jgi:Na+/melibiose symporter-like transporter
MADISAIFFILLIIGVAFPAMLTAWWLLFPSVVSRAQARVEQTPWRTFGMGIILMIVLTIPIVVLLALPFGPAKFTGWLLLAAALAVSSIGSAGIAAHLGERLTRQSSISALSGFVRGSVILELAAFFPVLGWFFVWPLLIIMAFGATGFALLNWMPREKQATSVSVAAPLITH